MATQTFQHGLLPSPTLTNPEMILPDDAQTSRFHYEQDHDLSHSKTFYQRQVTSVKLADAPTKRAPSPRAMTPTSTTASSYGSFHSVNGVQRTPSKHNRSVDILVAAENLRAKPSIDLLVAAERIRSKSPASSLNTWIQPRDSRSDSSGSVRTTDIEKLKFPGFDMTSRTKAQELTPRNSDEDRRSEAFAQNPSIEKPTAQVVESKPEEVAHVEVHQVEEEDQEEENDEVAPLPQTFDIDQESQVEPWPFTREDDTNIDEDTSLALSNRAEQILEDAKRRLHRMESNLRGARTSLTAPSSSLNTLKLQTEIQSQFHIARERDRRLYGGMGHIPPREKPYASPLTSPSHARGLSETFTPSSIPGGAVKKIHYSQKRASSALNVRTPWSPPTEGGAFPRMSIRNSRSQEQMRNDRLSAWMTPEPSPMADSPVGNPGTSPTNLDTLPEDHAALEDHPARPSSTTSDIRVQLDQLKGRISSLKERAKEDGLRRRSTQNLRTPSPFTQAEGWYSGSEAYKGDALSSAAGVGARSPVEGSKDDTFQTDAEKPREHVPSPTTAPATSAVTKQEDDEGAAETMELGARQHKGHHSTLIEEEDALTVQDFEDSGYAEEEDFADEEENYETADADDEAQSSADTTSVYEDASWEPVAERHEDRIDAFDYENFFLHSAMGTYNASRRSSSAGSEESVETTRPSSPLKNASRLSVPGRSPVRQIHRRHGSADSISTMQSFATATEGRHTAQSLRKSDSATSEGLDIITDQLLAQHNGLLTPLSAGFRADSAVLIPPNHKVLESQTPVQSILATLIAALPASADGTKPTLDDQDRELVTSLATSLENVFVNLHTSDVNTYDKRLWRRRLDDARRMLDGEGEGEAF